jgi:hypothetical protein
MSTFAEYIREISKSLEKGDSTEHTHHTALEALLEACGKEIDATNEPRRIACGAPDFNITRKGVPVGHIETKDIGVNLDEMERGNGPNGEQFKRYSTLPNWILTDYLELRWYAAGQKRLTVRVADFDGQGRIKAAPDGDEKLTQLLTAFYHEPALTVGTARELAQCMAGMTRITRDLIIASFKHETEETERKLVQEARESPQLNDLITEFPVQGTDTVEKVQYNDQDGRVWINPTQYFGKVPVAVWNFHIGGYQVCEKWLKDRKGRKLTYADTRHYQRIVVALDETIRVMTEIDEVIGQHGDWPAAFSSNNTPEAG